jgi:hypothetical protein
MCPVLGLGRRFSVLDAVWSFSGVWLNYPHRDGSLLYDLKDNETAGPYLGIYLKDNETEVANISKIVRLS